MAGIYHYNTSSKIDTSKKDLSFFDTSKKVNKKTYYFEISRDNIFESRIEIQLVLGPGESFPGDPRTGTGISLTGIEKLSPGISGNGDPRQSPRNFVISGFLFSKILQRF